MGISRNTTTSDEREKRKEKRKQFRKKGRKPGQRRETAAGHTDKGPRRESCKERRGRKSFASFYGS